MRRDLFELARPFPDKFVRDNPNGYGSYVPHHVVNQRLLQAVGPFNFRMVKLLRGDVADRKTGEVLSDVVVGVVCRLEVQVDGRMAEVEEAGDCENPGNWPHDGARLKDAMSDAFKRCSMRLGLGLHLWSQGDYFLDRALGKDDE